ncbi:MAG: serine hydroxymethyltransferase [Candidatus Micrarchaeota archaeon]|nr:serine hydroxymethyltransferase [Candidatus Micrarchaeota archaeon]
MAYSFVERKDPELAGALRRELKRQRETLGMIASENFCSMAVLEAQGSIACNKYAEGYPGRRYYEGNEHIDEIETLAIERAKTLFGAEHANVQPHAGTQANMAAYMALLSPGDKAMALNLDQGGHLSHGSKVNFSGSWYNFVHYTVDETGWLDYDAIEKMAKEEKPKLIVSGYSAYPREVDFKRFGEIASEVGAYHMADMAHIAGLVAGGVHQNPVPHADVVTTTTHKTLRGPRGALILCKEVHAKAIDKAVFPGMQGGPFEHSITAKAVCFKEAMGEEFKNYARQIVKNAKALADELMAGGMTLVSGGTDTHLMLVDVGKSGLTGKDAAQKLRSVGIVANKNMIPYDREKPSVTSGVRLGTPGLTTRGMKEGEMREVGKIICDVLVKKKEGGESSKKVRELCSKFPLYPELGA